MTSDRFDRTVAEWLHEDAEHHLPDHLEDVLGRTRRIHQRRWWSSPERWLPMQTTLRLAPVPRVAWLLVVLALAVVLTGVVLVVGSRPHLPPPFGLARNGSVVYSTKAGDVYKLDPETGASTAIIAGSTTDFGPYFSGDGAAFTFLRQTAVAGQMDLMAANPDGSGVRRLAGPFSVDDDLETTSDNTRLVVVSQVPGVPPVRVIDLVSGVATPLQIDMTVAGISWRPDGHELVFHAQDDGHGKPFGFYAIHPDGSGLRSIATLKGLDAIGPAMSPDGTKLAYITWDASRNVQGVVHIVDVDTGVVQTPVFDGVTSADEGPTWSPDSRRLLFQRYVGTTYHLAVAPAAGGHVTEIGPVMPYLSGGADAGFSPDGTKVLATYRVDSTTWILDAAGASQTIQAPPSIDGISWQRLAP